MKTSMTDQTEQTNAIVAIYGPPKRGKTFTLRTALPLGDVLHISSLSEGNAASCLRDYHIKHVTLENYYDLMALESVLLNKPPDWVGDSTDPPVAKIPKPLDPALIKQMRDFLGDIMPTTIGADGWRSLQADIFGGWSITVHGKDTGIGKYGDIGNLSRIHAQRLAFVPTVKMLVIITQDQQVSDKSMGGMESTYREMAFEGNASRGIIPPMCDMVLPIFTAAELGDGFKEWRCDVDPPGMMSDRYFPLVPFMGYWAGARVGLTKETTVRADLAHIWNKFYKKSKEAVSK